MSSNINPTASTSNSRNGLGAAFDQAHDQFKDLPEANRPLMIAFVVKGEDLPTKADAIVDCSTRELFRDNVSWYAVADIVTEGRNLVFVLPEDFVSNQGKGTDERRAIYCEFVSQLMVAHSVVRKFKPSAHLMLFKH